MYINVNCAAHCLGCKAVGLLESSQQHWQRKLSLVYTDWMAGQPVPPQPGIHMRLELTATRCCSAGSGRR